MKLAKVCFWLLMKIWDSVYVSFKRGKAFSSREVVLKIWLNLNKFNAASSLDGIKMTKNRFEFDRKKLTTMNLNVGT